MRLRTLACSALTLSMLATLAACTSSSAKPSPVGSGARSANCLAAAAKPVSSAGGALDLAAIAQGVAKKGPTVPGDRGRRVIVMEERHDSRAAQVEIAIMLERLYEDHGLRDLALEGAVVEKGNPTARWFYKLADPCTRTEVALNLLRQGEIGGAEFMAMIHPDFHLHAIEVNSQYSVNDSPAEQQALFAYLNALVKALAKGGGTAGQAQRLKHLYSLLVPAHGSTPPVEIFPRVIDGLVELARELHLNMGGAAQAIQQDRIFWLTAERRTVTMASKTIAALSHIPNGLIVLDIGAAHTQGFLGIMKERSISSAVLSPISISANQRHGDLTVAEYNRKQEGQLVGSPGTLGALLEQGHRFPPILDNPKFQTETAIMAFAEKVVQAAAGGGSGCRGRRCLIRLPTAATLGVGPWIEIPPGGISIFDRKLPAVIMEMVVNETGQKIWVAAWQAPAGTRKRQDLKTVLGALREILKDIQDKPAPGNKAEKSAAKAVPVRLGAGVIGVFGTDKETVGKAARTAIENTKATMESS